jgi:hypothetical protein
MFTTSLSLGVMAYLTDSTIYKSKNVLGKQLSNARITTMDKTHQYIRCAVK